MNGIHRVMMKVKYRFTIRNDFFVQSKTELNSLLFLMLINLNIKNLPELWLLSNLFASPILRA